MCDILEVPFSMGNRTSFSPKFLISNFLIRSPLLFINLIVSSVVREKIGLEGVIGWTLSARKLLLAGLQGALDIVHKIVCSLAVWWTRKGVTKLCGPVCLSFLGFREAVHVCYRQTHVRPFIRPETHTSTRLPVGRCIDKKVE